MKTLLVGLGHKARHGKDTVAMNIHCDMPRHTRLYSMASALKGFARVLGMRAKDGPLLQVLGTDVLRRLDPNIWIDILHAQIEEEAPRVAIIPDIRFPNEAEWIKAHGGFVVKIARWTKHGGPWVAPDRPADHPSETALDDYPFDDFYNVVDGDMDGLLHAARVIEHVIKARAGI